MTKKLSSTTKLLAWEDTKEWTIARVKRVKPVVILPLDIWRVLWQLAQFSRYEYSTLLEIEEEGPDRYRITDWYLPHQLVTGGSVLYTTESALGMVKDIGDHWEHYYGVHHVHPWSHKNLPAMSSIDVDEMWTWVANAGRGIFIVSDVEGKASATYVTKEGDLLYQIEMSLLIDYGLTEKSKEEFLELFEERVKPIAYEYGYRYDDGWPGKLPSKDDEGNLFTDEEIEILRILEREGYDFR